MTATAILTATADYTEIERDQMRDLPFGSGAARFVLTGEAYGTTYDGSDWAARLVHDDETDQWVVILEDPDYEETVNAFESQQDATDRFEAAVDRFEAADGFTTPGTNEWDAPDFDAWEEADYDTYADFTFATEY